MVKLEVGEDLKCTEAKRQMEKLGPFDNSDLIGRDISPPGVCRDSENCVTVIQSIRAKQCEHKSIRPTQVASDDQVL